MVVEMKNNFSEKNAQVLNGIKQLQQREKELYSALAIPNVSSDEKKKIIDEINNLSQMRINMYSNLQNMYSSYNTNASSLSSSVDSQFDTITTMETDLNEMKLHLNAIDQMKMDKLRTVTINNYYAKRYNAYKNIMFVISISCIPILLLTILNNKSIIPSNVYGLMITLIIIVSSYYIFMQYADISNRDSNNWDSYSWYFNKSEAPEPNDKSSSENGPDEEDDENDGEEDVCVGSACCQMGTIYDSSLNLCVPVIK
jgi:ABC-type multidrug transport system fused ATPase/permease subunit